MSVADNHEWQQHFKSWLTRTASAADDITDSGIRRIRRRFGREGVPKIQPYMGYASTDFIHLHGRVLTNPPISADYQSDRWWRNLSNAIQRFVSDEVPGVTVEATLDGQRATTTSDAEGYFHLELPRSESRDHVFWDIATLRILNHPRARRQSDRASCGVLSVPPDARYAIISDVDDTILHTGATDIATMAKLTFFGNARTRAPLDGVAELYEHLQRDTHGVPTNPIFYVSSSPWNLYDLLEDFLELNAIPRGPLLLRDLGFDENKFLKSGHDHKLDKARRLIKTFDQLPFLLFGDSGQEDARLYAAAAAEFPKRIHGIFIRDIDPDLVSNHDAKVDQYVRKSAEVGVPMYLVKDSTQAAEIAIEHGWLTPEAITPIQNATRRDVKRPEA
ncbi:phosphatidate phosphatase APP1 [Rhodopirellula rubra]|uniref:Phosphatidate phosphatase APP1 n=1 Tax=Aporhodopirellula rubra TaxID=980271 RepID=A0A7W5DX50_9BACT|nr:phosphatase domain-containing protein [Aporhodopirellula rubra]MBB3206161.1 phosphatidate phosphatase APP1 [Aporhodopirellula rubra]